MSTTWVNRAITPRPVPSPNSAVTIGSPIAISEPKVRSSTTIAASSPTAVATPKPDCSVCLDRLASELHLQAGTLHGPGDLDDAFGGALRQQVGFLVEHDGGEGDRARRRRSRDLRPRRCTG